MANTSGNNTKFACSQTPGLCPGRRCCSLFDSWVDAGGTGSVDPRYYSASPWCCDMSLYCSAQTQNACVSNPVPSPVLTPAAAGPKTWVIVVIVIAVAAVLVGLAVAMVVIGRRRLRTRREQRERDLRELQSRYRFTADGELVLRDTANRGESDAGSRQNASTNASGDTMSERSGSTDVVAARNVSRGRSPKPQLPIPRHGLFAEASGPAPVAGNIQSADGSKPLKGILRGTGGAEKKRASFRFSTKLLENLAADDEDRGVPVEEHPKAALDGSAVHAMVCGALPSEKGFGGFVTSTANAGYGFAPTFRHEGGDVAVVAFPAEPPRADASKSARGLPAAARQARGKSAAAVRRFSGIEVISSDSEPEPP
jgi:hypothetical protein